MKKSDLLFLGGLFQAIDFILSFVPFGNVLAVIFFLIFLFYFIKLLFKKKLVWIEHIREQHPYFDIYMNALGYVFYVSAVVFFIFIAADYVWDFTWRMKALVVFVSLYFGGIIAALVYASILAGRRKKQ